MNFSRRIRVVIGSVHPLKYSRCAITYATLFYALALSNGCSLVTYCNAYQMKLAYENKVNKNDINSIKSFLEKDYKEHCSVADRQSNKESETFRICTECWTLANNRIAEEKFKNMTICELQYVAITKYWSDQYQKDFEALFRSKGYRIDRFLYGEQKLGDNLPTDYWVLVDPNRAEKQMHLIVQTEEIIQEPNVGDGVIYSGNLYKGVNYKVWLADKADHSVYLALDVDRYRSKTLFSTYRYSFGTVSSYQYDEGLMGAYYKSLLDLDGKIPACDVIK